MDGWNTAIQGILAAEDPPESTRPDVSGATAAVDNVASALTVEGTKQQETGFSSVIDGGPQIAKPAKRMRNVLSSGSPKAAKKPRGKLKAAEQLEVGLAAADSQNNSPKGHNDARLPTTALLHKQGSANTSASVPQPLSPASKHQRITRSSRQLENQAGLMAHGNGHASDDRLGSLNKQLGEAMRQGTGLPPRKQPVAGKTSPTVGHMSKKGQASMQKAKAKMPPKASTGASMGPSRAPKTDSKAPAKDAADQLADCLAEVDNILNGL